MTRIQKNEVSATGAPAVDAAARHLLSNRPPLSSDADEPRTRDPKQRARSRAPTR